VCVCVCDRCSVTEEVEAARRMLSLIDSVTECGMDLTKALLGMVALHNERTRTQLVDIDGARCLVIDVVPIVRCEDDQLSPSEVFVEHVRKIKETAAEGLREWDHSKIVRSLAASRNVRVSLAHTVTCNTPFLEHELRLCNVGACPHVVDVIDACVPRFPCVSMGVPVGYHPSSCSRAA